ncbi:hypothetical protein [Aurantiacibacter poecillastricola]|uniref:hypothetical protein n=1 Tax=Aurantiacibacter poecillastricola TaxID=3064385 RepID=UPI00273F9B84|nr:hypothetical protein [Aurantiacibacter sp. 219JJ12-13]MDP5260831.1 hypothetical protein [Aurantiacibacter sp. 219JJ12-13]
MVSRKRETAPPQEGHRTLWYMVLGLFAVIALIFHLNPKNGEPGAGAAMASEAAPAIVASNAPPARLNK